MTNSPPLHILLLAESEPKAALDRRALREAGADRVECRTSGVEAARLLARIVPPLPDFFPQAVVCSQRLADMDGEQFCAMLRLHPLLLDLPVLLILPSDSEAEQLRTLGCGASALLARPYSVRLLKQHLTALTAARTGQEELERAKKLTDTRAFDRALETYALLLKPVRRPEDYFRVGMSCLEKRQWNHAIAAFQRALHGALLEGKAQLGMAVAWKGKEDMLRYREYLGQAAATFVRARQWHRAREVYARLLRSDPSAKNPFLAEAVQLMRQGAYDQAAEVLVQAAPVTPRAHLSARVADVCLSATEPQAMLQGLEAGLQRALGPEAGPLADDIRASLEELRRQAEAHRREEQAERQWRAARAAAAERRAAATAEKTQETPPRTAADASPGAGRVRPPIPGVGQKTPVAAPWGAIPSADTADKTSPAPPQLLPPLETEAASGQASGLGDLITIMQYTWRLARGKK